MRNSVKRKEAAAYLLGPSRTDYSSAQTYSVLFIKRQNVSPKMPPFIH